MIRFPQKELTLVEIIVRPDSPYAPTSYRGDRAREVLSNREGSRYLDENYATSGDIISVIYCPCWGAPERHISFEAFIGELRGKNTVYLEEILKPGEEVDEDYSV